MSRAGSWCRAQKRLAIWLRDGLACAYCGATVEGGALLTLDHLVPGGSHDAGNLITACYSCNSARGCKSIRRWYGVLRGKGLDAERVGRRVRRLVRKDLKPYRVRARTIMRSSGTVSATAALMASR